MNAFEPAVLTLADTLRTKGWRMATAESCTGGLIAAACTAVAGSSDWFERGFVTYSNEAKRELLAVPAELITNYGAVSEPVACAMASGALAHSHAHLAVAVTGIAGPGGGSAHKPVGTVWLAVARRHGATQAWLLQLKGDRSAVREQTVHHALKALREACA
jgi:nicotinamide-nucleotide amidase